MNKTILLPLLFVSSVATAQSTESNWYAGASIGFNHTDSDQFNVPSEKYAIKGGYQINDWLFAEAEFGKLGDESGTYCNQGISTDPCVTLKQKYSHLFIGLRGETFVTRSFGFTGRIGAARASYSSNLAADNDKTNISSAAGLIWKIGDSSKITLEIQQLSFALANKRDENAISSNLAFTMAF